MQTVVTFGEIMARLAPPAFTRLRQTRSYKVTYAGAEASVASSISNFGGKSRYVTALPTHDIADATVDSLRAMGVDTNYIVRSEKGRLGIYFLETGANQRPSNVIYDREYSSISQTDCTHYDWDNIFKGASWFHVSGITPAISEQAAQASILACQMAKAAGCTVSVDLNYRKKLWKWDNTVAQNQLAKEVMGDILSFTDVLIANEEDCENVLGIKAKNTNVNSGSLDTSKYPEVAQEVFKLFPNLNSIAITLRESHSASHNSWGAMLAYKDATFFAPIKNKKYVPYEIKSIVDRVGSGDSFAAALIYVMNYTDYQYPTDYINFAVAASALKHSIKGDLNYSSKAEVEALMNGSSSGRVNR